MKRIGFLLSIVLVILFFNSVAFGIRWCATVNDQLIRCEKTEGVCAVGTEEIATCLNQADCSECITPICCYVKSVDNTFISTSIFLPAESYNMVYLFPYACEKIKDIYPQYEFFKWTYYENSDCAEMDLKNQNPGFYKLESGRVCNIKLILDIKSSDKHLNDVVLNLSLKLGETLLYQDNKIVNSPYVVEFQKTHSCEEIEKNGVLEIKASKRGYVSFSGTPTVTKEYDESNQILQIKGSIDLTRKTDVWVFKIKFVEKDKGIGFFEIGQKVNLIYTIKNQSQEPSEWQQVRKDKLVLDRVQNFQEVEISKIQSSEKVKINFELEDSAYVGSKEIYIEPNDNEEKEVVIEVRKRTWLDDWGVWIAIGALVAGLAIIIIGAVIGKAWLALVGAALLLVPILLSLFSSCK
ncbi:MAG: hypothetical protein QXD62_03225 [Candidatus Woesearchaeota archaeon]